LKNFASLLSVQFSVGQILPAFALLQTFYISNVFNVVSQGWTRKVEFEFSDTRGFTSSYISSWDNQQCFTQAYVSNAARLHAYPIKKI